MSFLAKKLAAMFPQCDVIVTTSLSFKIQEIRLIYLNKVKLAKLTDTYEDGELF